MLQRLILSISLLLACAAAAQAGIIAGHIKQVNPGSQAAPYNGFVRNQTTNPAPTGPFASDTQYNSGALSNTWVSYVLTLTPTSGTKVSGVDITLTAPVSPNSGFHQVWARDPDDPSAPPVATPNGSAAQIINADSHLIRGSVSVIDPAENRVTTGGPPIGTDTATRSYGYGSSLNGVWGYNLAEQSAQQHGVPVNIAYIVVPRGLDFSGALQVRAEIASNDAQGQPQPIVRYDALDFFGFGPPPPPPMITLVDIGERGIALGTIVQQLSATGFPQWLNLMQTKGPPVAIQPTLSGGGLFSWDPTGSITGAKGSGKVVYEWSADVVNLNGHSGFQPAFRLTLIPEPATFALTTLATLTALGLVRSRRNAPTLEKG